MGIGIDNTTQKCLECGQHCVNRRSLGNHVARSHKDLGGLKAYVLKHFLSGLIPKCGCGCNRDVEWHKLLYKFNDYITGHNPAGFRVKQHVFTQEQMQHRNASLKLTYSDPKLREKIASSVTEAFKDPDKKHNLIVGQLNGWDNEERRAKASVVQKQAWTVDHDERVKRVFTPEFSEKMSIIMTQKYLDGGYAWAKGKYQSTKTARTCYYRSSWELLFMQSLDTDPSVAAWEYEFTHIAYSLNGKSRRYVPDFHVIYSDGHHALIEVKPQNLRETCINAAKRAAAQQYCVERGWEYVEWEPQAVGLL